MTGTCLSTNTTSPLISASDTDLLSRSLDTFISKLMYPSGSVSNTVIDAVRTLLKIDTDAFLSFIVAVAL